MFVGSPLSMAVQRGLSASAWSVRQMPPPAVATQARQSPALPAAPQSGPTTSAVTRPEVTESFRLSVVGPGAKGTSGPANCQVDATAVRAWTSGVPGAKARVPRRVGSAATWVSARLTCAALT